MVRRDPVGIRLITRRGNDWTQRYPLVAEAVCERALNTPHLWASNFPQF
jgi:ATP-dependent DNA ligase